MNIKLNPNKLSVIVVNKNYYHGKYAPCLFTKDYDKWDEFVLKLGRINHDLYKDLDSNNYDVLDQTIFGFHPDLQIVHAELLIVQFAVDKRCRVILTHSPYFLNAIEAYGDKYGVLEKMDWYLQTDDGELQKVEYNHSDLLYKPLVRALEDIESIPYNEDEEFEEQKNECKTNTNS